jgi:antitoxin HicB
MPNDTKRNKSTKRSPSSKVGPKPEDYQVVLRWSEDDQCYVATLPAWQNAQTHGTTLEEAARNAREVLAMLIGTARRRHETVPPAERALSGNLHLRLPVSLHGRLVREAEREGVSLNQWIVTKLAS